MFIIDAFIFIIFALFAIVILTPILLIIYGIVKKKRKLVTVTVIVTLSLMLMITIYFCLFPTHFPYVDLWIKGKTADEIISVYGEPDYSRNSEICYIVGKDNGFFGIMSSNLDECYCIRFDEKGLADEISIGLQPGG